MNYIEYGSVQPSPDSLLKQICEDSDSSRLIQRTPASYLCPSLVMISVFDEEANRWGWQMESVGFIVRYDEEYSVVVGLSDFLYKSDPEATGPHRKLEKGKVVVSLAGNPLSESLIHKSDIATVLSVDFHFGLVFLKYKNRYRIKPAKLGSFDAILKSKTMICLDFHDAAARFVARLYDLITDDKVECSCTYGHEDGQCYRYLHVESFDPYLTALILDHNAQIVGFRVGRCELNEGLSHIMQIDHFQGFFKGTLSFPDRDVRYPAAEGAESSTSLSPGKTEEKPGKIEIWV